MQLGESCPINNALLSTELFNKNKLEMTIKKLNFLRITLSMIVFTFRERES
jgi:hypothetical protein